MEPAGIQAGDVFTSGWRLRIYSGIAVVAGLLVRGLLMAFCGY